jgi:hypothetical protein
MQSIKAKKAENGHKEPFGARPKMIAGILQSALGIEEEISGSVYRDYMDRRNWPAEIKDKTFEEIRKNLSTLLDDTRRHKRMVRYLLSKLESYDG